MPAKQSNFFERCSPAEKRRRPDLRVICRFVGSPIAALLDAIEPANSAERKQRDKALKSLAAAHKAVNCAEARRIDPGAACP